MIQNIIKSPFKDKEGVILQVTYVEWEEKNAVSRMEFATSLSPHFSTWGSVWGRFRIEKILL